MEYSKAKISAIYRGISQIQFQSGSYIAWKHADEPDAVNGAGWYIWSCKRENLDTCVQLLLYAEQRFLQLRTKTMPVFYFQREAEKRRMPDLVEFS